MALATHLGSASSKFLYKPTQSCEVSLAPLLAKHLFLERFIVFQQFDPNFIINLYNKEFNMCFFPSKKTIRTWVSNVPKILQTCPIKYKGHVHGNAKVMTLVLWLPQNVKL